METTMELKIDKTIDARGSLCPGPLLELIRGVKSVGVGQTVQVFSSDPGSNKDIPAWVTKANHEMIGTYPEDGYSRFVIKKMH